MDQDTRDVHRQPGGNSPQIPGYEIKKRLGKGGMAEVYLAFQENLDREVAIKILDPIFLKDEKLIKRFIYEAKTAAKLIHNNIVTIHDVGRSGGHHYIVMELLNESLRDRLKRRGKLSAAKALVIIKTIANALFYAHNKNIIHRDIKPDNIMFRSDDTPVLVDFGIARALDLSTHLTMTGVRIGTPYYMSTEQCKGEELDGRSDIYSLGIVLFELLTGDVPYKSETPTGLIYQHLQAPLPELTGKLKKYQPLIDKMMEKEKEKRIKNGQELIKIIESLQRDGKSIVPGDSSVHKDSIVKGENLIDSSTYRLPATFIQRLFKYKKILAGAIAMVIVMLLGVVTYHFINTSKKDKIVEDRQPGKDPPEIKHLTREPIESLTSRMEKGKIEYIKKNGNVKATGDSRKINSIKRKDDIKTPVQKKKDEKVKTKRDDAILSETITEQKIKIAIVAVPASVAHITVEGKIEFYLSVNEKGNIRIEKFIDTGLEVTPPDKREEVKNMISTKINSISISPPKDETGEPIKIKNWWKKFSVATNQGKIIFN
jgi:serine/threonine protein kinase